LLKVSLSRFQEHDRSMSEPPRNPDDAASLADAHSPADLAGAMQRLLPEAELAGFDDESLTDMDEAREQMILLTRLLDRFRLHSTVSGITFARRPTQSSSMSVPMPLDPDVRRAPVLVNTASRITDGMLHERASTERLVHIDAGVSAQSYMVTHEFAHVLETATGQRARDEYLRHLRDTFAADVVFLDRRSTKVILRKAFDAEAISQYARLGGPKEAIAEAFAATETSPGRATAVGRTGHA
jgi:hypothetical protein